jgi:protein PhnA
MSAITERAAGQCELCGQSASLEAVAIAAAGFSEAERSLALCATCTEHLHTPDGAPADHWEGLQDAAWSGYPAVQAATYRILKAMTQPPTWAAGLLDTMYVDEAWLSDAADDTPTVHQDAHGNILQNGDTVTLTQDLNVKGTSFTAKRGAAVRRIRLVEDNPGQIEGKVNDQTIVILTKFVKKSAD